MPYEADISNVKIRDNGTKLRLTWNWDKGLKKVLVVYSDRDFPTGPDDPKIINKKEITLEEYNVEKAFVMKSRQQGYYFSIHSVIEHSGTKKYSAGVQIQTRQSVINYDITIKRKYWFFGHRYLKITVISEDAIPALVVLGREDKSVWSRESGSVVDEIPPTSQTQLIHILPYNRLKGIAYIRLFVKDEQLKSAYDVIALDSKKLQIR